MEKIRVLFVCLGNICRSPMAQFVFQDRIDKLNLSDRFYIDSKATSYEEYGNSPHLGTIRKLNKENIRVLPHKSDVLEKADYDNFDYIIGMDSSNYRNIIRIIGEDKYNKVSLFLDFSDRPRDIADPWYTGNFDKTYSDILEGIEGFIKYLKEKSLI